MRTCETVETSGILGASFVAAVRGPGTMPHNAVHEVFFDYGSRVVRNDREFALEDLQAVLDAIPADEVASKLRERDSVRPPRAPPQNDAVTV